MGCAECQMSGVAFHREDRMEILSFAGELIPNNKYKEVQVSTSVLDGGWVVNTMPRPFSPTRQGPSTHCTGAEWVLGATLKGVKITEFLAPPGFEPRTVLSLAIRYTDPQVCVCVCVCMCVTTFKLRYSNFTFRRLPMD